MKFREVWSGLGRDFREGKIKAVTVGWAEVFEVIRSKHQHPQCRYQWIAVNVLISPHISCSILNSEREERCAPLIATPSSLRGSHVKLIYTKAWPYWLEARHAA